MDGNGMLDSVVPIMFVRNNSIFCNSLLMELIGIYLEISFLLILWQFSSHCISPDLPFQGLPNVKLDSTTMSFSCKPSRHCSCSVQIALLCLERVGEARLHSPTISLMFFITLHWSGLRNLGSMLLYYTCPSTCTQSYYSLGPQVKLQQLFGGKRNFLWSSLTLLKFSPSTKNG